MWAPYRRFLLRCASASAIFADHQNIDRLFPHIAAEAQFEAFREQDLEHLRNLTLPGAGGEFGGDREAGVVHPFGPLDLEVPYAVGGTNALFQRDIGVPNHARIDTHARPHLSGGIGIKGFDGGDFEGGFVCGLLGKSEAK